MMNIILRTVALILILQSGLAMAKITQSLDRRDITAGETFVLDIQIENEDEASPDLSMIPSDFTIVSNSQYQHTQIINGSRSSIKGWKIKLKTLKPGLVTIPSISVGKEKTQPIQLNIKESSYRVDINGQNKAIFVTAEVDISEPYVQQQVIYTVSLYRSVATHYENLGAPILQNSIIEKLGEDLIFEKMIDNRRYNVYQRKYAIFPQQSGPLEISPVVFTADVNDSNSRSRSPFLSSTRPISVSTQAISLQVKPQPATAQSPWLPAQSVMLSDRWSNPSLQLKVGEPVTWTVQLNVQGLSESQLPEINIPKVNGLQVYPDTPQKERQVNEYGILGQRIEKFAVIPSKEGQITIPAFQLSWWDTKSNQQKTASLPARTLMVIAPDIVPTSNIDIQQMQPQAPIPANSTDADIVRWKMISAAILLLWLVTLLAYFNKKAVTGNARQSTNKNPDKRFRQSQKQAIKLAYDAIKNQSAKAVEQAILQLANHQALQQLENAKSKTARVQFHSLGALTEKLTDASVIEKLNQLDQQLYSPHSQPTDMPINKADLEQIISDLSATRKNAAYQAIPPLYPR